jgi:hypothetical protein
LIDGQQLDPSGTKRLLRFGREMVLWRHGSHRSATHLQGSPRCHARRRLLRRLQAVAQDRLFLPSPLQAMPA